MDLEHHGEPTEAQLFHRGISLFNEHEWFEAHEVWEEIWHMAGGQKKLFYQGLIQCAVTLEHLRRGNPRGVRNVYETARAKFRGLSGVYMGIDVPRLLGDLERTVRPTLNLPAAAFDPSLPQGQELPFDQAGAPHITLGSDPFAGEEH